MKNQIFEPMKQPHVLNNDRHIGVIRKFMYVELISIQDDWISSLGKIVVLVL